MRYFLSLNASRQLITGGLSLTFMKTTMNGGSWTGILEVDDASGAIIATDHPEYVQEITQAQYEDLKKKHPTISPPYQPSAPPQPGIQIQSSKSGHAVVVNHTQELSKPETENEKEGVHLKITANNPPVETIFADSTHKKVPWYKAVA